MLSRSLPKTGYRIIPPSGKTWKQILQQWKNNQTMKPCYSFFKWLRAATSPSGLCSQESGGNPLCRTETVTCCPRTSQPIHTALTHLRFRNKKVWRTGRLRKNLASSLFLSPTEKQETKRDLQMRKEKIRWELHQDSSAMIQELKPRLPWLLGQWSHEVRTKKPHQVLS